MSNLKITQAKVEKQKISVQKTKIIYEVDEFSNTQNKLYKELLFGLSNFKPEELKKINYQEQNRINKLHRKAQSLLNLWKQELCNKYVNDLFTLLFPNSQITKQLTEDYGNLVDPSFKNYITFKDLGVSKKDIVSRLIKHELLPQNFFELK